MSSIDLTNDQVRANYIKSKIQEGEGDFYLRKEVTVFMDESGREYVVPQDMEISDEQKKNMKVLEASEVEELKGKKTGQKTSSKSGSKSGSKKQ